MFVDEVSEQKSEGYKLAMRIYMLYASCRCGDWCEVAADAEGARSHEMAHRNRAIGNQQKVECA